MSIELSPEQEKRLHSILDHGIDIIRSSRDNSSAHSSIEETSSRRLSQVSGIQDEVHMLQAKISRLESMLNEPEKKNKKRPSKALKSSSSEYAIKELENEIESIERAITPGIHESSKHTLTKDNSRNAQLLKENAELKKKIKKQEDMLKTIQKLQKDYQKLTASFQRSENIRTKQKAMIEMLRTKLTKKSRIVRVSSLSKRIKKTSKIKH